MNNKERAIYEKEKRKDKAEKPYFTVISSLTKRNLKNLVPNGYKLIGRIFTFRDKHGDLWYLQNLVWHENKKEKEKENE